MSDPLQAIAATRTALEDNASARWIIGFSGGKDSTAALKIFTAAFQKARPRPSFVDIVYCDTGVENVVLDQYVRSLFRSLKKEFREEGLPFRVNILTAPVSDRFFVKVIGRGYPPPTNSFRWCTKNLRIKPVAKFIGKAAAEDAIVVLGMRRSESAQRDRSIKKSGGSMWQLQREGKHAYRLFLPIIDLDLGNVWDAVFMLGRPISIDHRKLEAIYRGASGECPMIKAPDAPPCASGRFGCWTCTVVRRDRSAEALIEAGETSLKPYLDFRNWLAEVRNKPDWRWPFRRNGVLRPGPFTLNARNRILGELTLLEAKTGGRLLGALERKEIFRLWDLDVPIERENGLR
ncbi:phosphoadenosine phosphosulfate reductase family protein [Nitratireductor sp. B36]|uniref:phosphoadenosine phosphosulfate reductase domain-containing protein n=1 Tax=Nitratireductor sp. B36 TaxID=2762059 RepID=UPI001E3F0AE8|nr:phosphoadenosine phosphosulfate reductase family protein [Nitratireductor sp. B36]MCC5778504.1 phosphoadenosine phosphosulfate reductase family protein [Nitratireductor sp. B36]